MPCASSPNSADLLSKHVLLALHDEQLAEHGGLPGIRDEGLLESALDRPRNLDAYGNGPDMADLATAYAYGLARNHPFADGNKRASLVTAETFLVLNGFELDVGDAEIVIVWQRLAAGEIAETDLAAWVRAHMVALG